MRYVLQGSAGWARQTAMELLQGADLIGRQVTVLDPRTGRPVAGPVQVTGVRVDGSQVVATIEGGAELVPVADLEPVVPTLTADAEGVR